MNSPTALILWGLAAFYLLIIVAFAAVCAAFVWFDRRHDRKREQWFQQAAAGMLEEIEAELKERQ
jgi:HAMP domain-containing protein